MGKRIKTLFIETQESLPQKFEFFESTWQAPSNIAIVKYWGKAKSGIQLPAHPNFSFTLEKCLSQTKVYFKPREGEGVWVDLFFQGERKESFVAKVESFLKRVSHYWPWIKRVHFKIDTFNTFPYGTGMASSASAMAALALCLNDFRQNLFGKEKQGEEFYRESSFLARLGSGSACRSLYPRAATWGVEDQTYGSPFKELHPLFHHLKDFIVIVSQEEKKISSKQGHFLMEKNPYQQVRYERARKNWQDLKEVLIKGDFMAFAEVCEAEALCLHAMMMTSQPPYMLLKAESLTVMEKVIQWRSQGLPVCYTLDAGPNVHILFSASCEQEIRTRMKEEILPLAPHLRWIEDGVGNGPKVLK